MKRVIKWALRAVWRATGPLRRPLRRKFEASLHRVIVGALPPPPAPPPPPPPDYRPELLRLEAAGNTANALSYEMNLALDSLIREVARLQIQIELLEEEVRRGPGRRGLSLVSGAEDDAPGRAAG